MEKANWIEEEIEGVDFGDSRLTERLGNILEALGEKPNESIPLACRGWKEIKAAYRFFSNKKVDEAKILSAHQKASIERIKREKVVLLIQDTTSLDFTGKSDISGLGKIGNHNHCQGMNLHAMLAVTPNRISLGCVGGKFWIRKEDGIRNDRHKKKIEEKESYRWVEGFKIAEKISEEAADTVIVNVADRESDIYELFLQTHGIREGKGAHWLVRCSQNRRVASVKGSKKLFEVVQETQALGTIEFDLPKGRGRKKRHIKQELKIAKVKLEPSSRSLQGKPKIEINAVLAEEMTPPKGEEKTTWVLLTSLPITRYEEAIEIVKWYLCRWQIELFFKALKTGCRVEELQLETADRIKICVTLYMIIAWRILFVTMQGRRCPDMPCNILFEDEEWKSVYAVTYGMPPPKRPPSLSEMIRMIAMLGGFIGRKSDGYPGMETLWQGMQRMRDFAIAWTVFNSKKYKRYG